MSCVMVVLAGNPGHLSASITRGVQVSGPRPHGGPHTLLPLSLALIHPPPYTLSLSLSLYDHFRFYCNFKTCFVLFL